MTDQKRRRVLQAGFAVPLLRWGGAYAQSPDRNLLATERPEAPGVAPGGSLLRAPRRALVIGNSRYGFGPLKNPANDARAIGEQLKQTGFEVTIGVDLPRREMLGAIDAYFQALSRTKAVGLFYFAGHGVQLAWRNYLLPTDAAIERLEDIQAKCVDVNMVIGGIAKAANPMNVIILDACRENPFGRDMKLEQKGLSQLDAPPGTLLAYATAPGNLANDGDGANGLYTEHLLREMKVPEAKLEDVFKRVRLAVRLRSNGAQIPWESTSLEQDFWFIPPRSVSAPSEAEADRRLAEELAQWEKVKASTTSGPLEEFLRRLPSGNFAELAQLRLDAILARQGEQRIQIASSQGNPFTQGFARADTAYKIGDRYRYQLLDLYSKVVQRAYGQRVTAVNADEIVYNDGRLVTDPLGNVLQQADGITYSSNQQIPAEFFVGKRWRTRFTASGGARGDVRSEMDFRVVKRERITVPAGTFNAFRVDGQGTWIRATQLYRVTSRTWFAPEQVRRFVARDYVRTIGRGQDAVAERIELMSFRQA